MPFTGNAHNRQIHRDRKQIRGCQELRGRGMGWGVIANAYGASFAGDGNVLERESGDVCTTL